jgi:hypothetical protein
MLKLIMVEQISEIQCFLQVKVIVHFNKRLCLLGVCKCFSHVAVKVMILPLWHHFMSMKHTFVSIHPFVIKPIRGEVIKVKVYENLIYDLAVID